MCHDARSFGQSPSKNSLTRPPPLTQILLPIVRRASVLPIKLHTITFSVAGVRYQHVAPDLPFDLSSPVTFLRRHGSKFDKADSQDPHPSRAAIRIFDVQPRRARFRAPQVGRGVQGLRQQVEEGPGLHLQRRFVLRVLRREGEPRADDSASTEDAAEVLPVGRSRSCERQTSPNRPKAAPVIVIFDYFW